MDVNSIYTTDGILSRVMPQDLIAEQTFYAALRINVNGYNESYDWYTSRYSTAAGVWVVLYLKKLVSGSLPKDTEFNINMLQWRAVL
jgi:hypothetical protein